MARGAARGSRLGQAGLVPRTAQNSSAPRFTG